MESWEKFGRVGLEWELNWTWDYVSKGYGKKDVELLAGEMMDTFNKLDALCNKQVKNSKVLEKWVVDMQKKTGCIEVATDSQFNFTILICIFGGVQNSS